MGFHTFDADRAGDLESLDRYRHLSAEEVVGAAAIATDDSVLDLGSGTGFYTDSLAAVAGRVYAVDLQPEMHAHYREKGMPDGVEPVVAEGGSLPFATDALDVAVSTMTYHELPAEAVGELARVLRPGGRLVVADWTASGPGEAGPPVDERFDAWTAGAALGEAGFEVRRVESRRETFFVLAVR